MGMEKEDIEAKLRKLADVGGNDGILPGVLLELLRGNGQSNADTKAILKSIMDNSAKMEEQISALASVIEKSQDEIRQEILRGSEQSNTHAETILKGITDNFTKAEEKKFSIKQKNNMEYLACLCRCFIGNRRICNLANFMIC